MADHEQQILDAFNQAGQDALVRRMGIKILEASASRVVGTMPVAGNTQPYGLLHGGASCVLAETLGSLGSALHAGPDRITVGIEISATHHRGAADRRGNRGRDALARRPDAHHVRDRHH